MGVLTNFDIDTNFWQVNPQFKIPKVFKDLYTKDKSKNKDKSSKLMWAVSMLIDNSQDNKFRNLLYSDRKALIAEDYIGDPEFNWDSDEMTILIEEYIKFNTTKIEKSLMIYEQKLEERDKFIKDVQYTLDNAAQLDKIISSTKSIFEFITKLKDEISKEAQSGETKGSMIESIGEQGLI